MEEREKTNQVKIGELSPHTIYACNQNSSWYIFKTSELGLGYMNFIYLPSKTWRDFIYSKSNEKNFKWSGYTIYEATQLEKEWLELCINAGKILPKPLTPKTINNYEIY
jgi:hypothetical protein